MAEELGQSAVPYNPTIIEKTIITENKTDFIFKNANLIIISGQQLGTGTTILLTVEAGYTFFVTSLQMSACRAAAAAAYYADLMESQTYLALLTSYGRADSVNTSDVSLSFPIPLEFKNAGGVTIESSNANIKACVTGFLIKNEALTV